MGMDCWDALKEFAGKRIFFIADPFMVKSKMTDQVISHIPNPTVKIFSNIIPDPPVSLAAEGVAEIRAFEPDMVFALGGGSAIDTAKAIREFSYRDAEKQIPLVVFPTTIGTGSEVTSFCVLTDDKTHQKYPLVDDRLLPDYAILNPQMVETLPAALAAETAMDALTHALESLVSAKRDEISMALAQNAACSIFQYFVPGTIKNEFTAREKLLYASCMAGIAFDQTSLGVCHAIAHNAGGRLKISHGKLNGILLPHVIRFNAGMLDREQLGPFADIYALLAEAAKIEGTGKRNKVKNLISAIEKLRRQANLPSCLADCGVTREKLQEEIQSIISGALEDGCLKTNPVPVSSDDIRLILERAV